ncbi:MAG: response regulator transcription factor [Anaerococcus vaginalis]|uniref:response regulator transcription factor n=1 Tax=Anaerococcus vaginalis TaxID=33037 RepID=UPI00242EA2ED|nr:response regulator transcription factor [Anaerococcus vaginalis]MDU5965451.1 response regulator transcription factor [Actinomyces sp.]MBS6920520.1 response regulator transcription factor [Anaerococcus vaginalis]MDU5251860.1 response regulator transcription factor [Anaerococcus vaginalis]MDU5988757.1 response regulator transcription factor [Anaerococcus vaginalis]MDU6781377.1 response regulator transcription factor [Anaerococcus vaginalis]
MSRILIVEDELDLANIIKDYLEKELYEVEICTEGDKAIEIFDKFKPSLVILDLMLPGMNGYEICQNIRIKSTIPILILSAKIDEFDKVKGLDLGADDYITKPFRPRELLARVNAQLRRSQVFNKENLEIIEIENIRIYTKEYKVEKDGRDLDLSRNEFELLIFLSKNPRQVFSREQLYDRIWGFDSYGDLNTVTVTINRLRQKIEDNPKNPKYILTVWGVGYKFEI